jgi:hypothetical protein
MRSVPSRRCYEGTDKSAFPKPIVEQRATQINEWENNGNSNASE